MASLPPVTIRQPQPHDIVNIPLGVSGIGTGFEAVVGFVRVRDANGSEVTAPPGTRIVAGGTGSWDNFHVDVPLARTSATALGTLEIYNFSQADGSEMSLVTIPIVFGPVLTAPDLYHGFGQHTVVRGDTLAGIARERYGDATKWPRIFEANRHQLNDPDQISVGQVLRVPE